MGASLFPLFRNMFSRSECSTARHYSHDFQAIA